MFRERARSTAGLVALLVTLPTSAFAFDGYIHRTETLHHLELTQMGTIADVSTVGRPRV